MFLVLIKMVLPGVTPPISQKGFQLICKALDKHPPRDKSFVMGFCEMCRSSLSPESKILWFLAAKVKGRLGLILGSTKNW